MKKILSFDEIKNCLLGAERIWQKNGSVCACRFTEEEQKTFGSNPDFLAKSYSNSNMIISFFTDAEKIIMEYEAASASSRYFSFLDVKVDDILVAHSGTDDVRNESSFSMELPLPGKKCKVEIFLPPLCRIAIQKLSLVNCTIFQASPRQKLIISYGDSITQGYDAKYPICSYTAILADTFDAELINKAIGGDIFDPVLVKNGTPGRTPDLVTVAYGTNDWALCSQEDIPGNCENFFSALSVLYPTSPIAVILPIWRKDHDKVTRAGDFFAHREQIKKIAERFSNTHIIDGLYLTPHLEEFYSDLRLHPNDTGFLFMGRNLTAELLKCLPALQN